MLVPASCIGTVCVPGTLGVVPPGQLIGVVAGKIGYELSAFAKSKADVKSPHTMRRQALMFGSVTPVQVSRNRMSEVWSNTCVQTYPPRVQGETMSVGTRMPSPIGWPPTNSSGVPGGGTGAGT